MKKRPVPEDLDMDERQKLSLWHFKKWPYHFKVPSDRRHFLRLEVDTMLDWHRQTGTLRADYLAAARNWIRKSMEQRGYEPYTPPSSPVNSGILENMGKHPPEPIQVGLEEWK